MPKASKDTAARVEDMAVMEGRYEEIGDYTVGSRACLTAAARARTGDMW